MQRIATEAAKQALKLLQGVITPARVAQAAEEVMKAASKALKK